MFKGARPIDEAPTGAAPGSSGGSLPSPFSGARRADSGPAGAGSVPVDLADDMPWYEKVLVGAGKGMSTIGTGIVAMADKTGMLGDDAKDYLKRQKEDRDIYEKYHPGGWATAGEIGGEIVATLPVGGAVGLGGRAVGTLFPKVAAKVGPASWTGLAARGGAEGAATGAITGATNDDVAGGAESGGITGAFLNAVLPKSIKALGRGGARVVRELSPTDAAAKARGLDALNRALGGKTVDEIAEAIDNAPPSMIPRTTAGMSGNPRAGALEAGARTRGHVDFAPFDEAVDKAAWGQLQDATKSANQIESLKKGATDIMAQGKELMGKLPLSQKNRATVSQELLKLRNSDEIIANPQLAKEIDNAIAAMDNPEATLGVLPQLYWRLGKEAGDSTTIQQVREVLRNIADTRSGGQFTNMQQGYSKTMDQLSAAEAAKRLRMKYVDETGFPITTKYSGEIGTDAIPNIDSASLRRTVAKEGRAGNVGQMHPDDVQALAILADQLRNKELYKTASGARNAGMGEAEGASSAILNSGPFWRLRGVLGSTFKGLNEQSQKAIDNALLNPDEFMAMVEKRRAANQMLAPWENKLDAALRGISRSNSVQEE